MGFIWFKPKADINVGNVRKSTYLTTTALQLKTNKCY